MNLICECIVKHIASALGIYVCKYVYMYICTYLPRLSVVTITDSVHSLFPMKLTALTANVYFVLGSI